MTNDSTESRWHRAMVFAVLVLAAILFALQLRSLFLFPEPNSIRWFGDETWLMTEARQQIATRIVTYPLAVGSQLAHGKGLVLSLTWLSSFLYGLPALIAGGDPVIVGRCVTAALALGVLVVLYFAAFRLGVSRFAASISVLLLVSARAFFFASHSARPDLLAGLIVLGVVAWLVHASANAVYRSGWWWFAFGAVIAFLAVSSSIHLVTLLLPVAAYFVWRMTRSEVSQTRRSAILPSIAGAISMFALLVLVYYLTTGSLALFPPSVERGQFHDVLHAIPILRPFSRSVQEANIVIRFKQFIMESPIIFLLPILTPFVWRRERNGHTLAVATIIVGLSWLLLQGAEINYLIHVLPLLMMCLAIAISRVQSRWGFSVWIFAVIGIGTFIAGVCDSSAALANATIIDRSNRSTARAIELAIDSTWREARKPLVLTEPPMLDRLLQDSSLRTMTDHFISFPERVEPFDMFFAREEVDYVVLYNSPAYPKNRPRDDPSYRSVIRSSTVIGTEIGRNGDIGRNYFNGSDWMDTVLIVKLHRAARR